LRPLHQMFVFNH